MVLQTPVPGLGKVLPLVNSRPGIYASRILLSDIFLFTAISIPPTWKISAPDTRGGALFCLLRELRFWVFL